MKTPEEAESLSGRGGEKGKTRQKSNTIKLSAQA